MTSLQDAWKVLDDMKTADDGPVTIPTGCSYCGSDDVRCEWPVKVCNGCHTVLDRIHFNAHKARKAESRWNKDASWNRRRAQDE